MRTIGGLHARLCEPDFLEHALDVYVRGKRRRPDVAWLLFRREEVLARIESELRDLAWTPRGFELFLVRDPKPRLIARAPVEDRVVHAALALAMEPGLSPSFAPDDYACRPGMGTQRAVLRLLAGLRRHRFVLHLDVRSYFASVDTKVLMALLARKIRDARFLELLSRVLASGVGLFDDPKVRKLARMEDDWPPPGRGLPIGTRTSQLFAAHVYLQELDHRVKRGLGVPVYVRYVDDLFLFGDRRADMRRWREEIGAWLAEKRHLRLKHPLARILSCHGHLDGLGYRLTREGIRPLPRAWKRLRAGTARWVREPWRSEEELQRSLESRLAGIFFG